MVLLFVYYSFLEREPIENPSEALESLNTADITYLFLVEVCLKSKKSALTTGGVY